MCEPRHALGAGSTAAQQTVQVWAFEKDLSHEAACTALYHAIKAQNITISLLVNNAGMGGLFHFEERGHEYYNTMIRLNAMVPAILTRLFLDDLRQSTPAFILNVSSMAGIFHPPQKCVYSGCRGSRCCTLAMWRVLR
jgi:short-subunit dehydrogenase